MDDFVMDKIMPLFFAVFFLGVFAVVLVGAGEVIQSRRAFAATTACEVKQSIPRRALLSSTVICVPAIQRQDTTSVTVISK